MILISKASKQVSLLELTIPREERKEEAKMRRRARYTQLVVGETDGKQGVSSQGWDAENLHAFAEAQATTHTASQKPVGEGISSLRLT